jgi:hypothetical protein
VTGTLAALAVIALVAFGTEGAIGFAATVIAVSLGAQLVPLDELLPAFVPVNMMLSLWLLVTGWRAIAWRVLVVEVVPMVAVGAAAGLALFHMPNKAALAAAFGGFVAALATLQLLRPAARPLAPPWRLAMLGAGGVAHGLFGTGGPMIVYVMRRRITERAANAESGKRTFRATLAVLWFSLNIGLCANFASLGLYERRTLDTGLAIAAAVLPGLWIGERIHRALDAAWFERVVWGLLLCAGAALAIRSALAG